ncbi:MAG: type IX secretion system membrane protein PorP/SprF [Flavobacteriia bacterium]|nr:type IX secretion system membrane protein PorP/SprF [Flavobacteriia bacterium]
MKLIYTFLFLLLFVFIHGQQIPQYSQWFWNLYTVNPAFVGLKPCLEMKALYRDQYVHFEGAPKSGFFTFSTPIYTEKKKFLTPRQGIGFKLESDFFGPFNMNHFLLSYAGHFNFTTETRLSIGLSAGFKQWSFDKNKTTTLYPDPVVNESRSVLSPDANLGIWWNGTNYFIGLSFNELTGSSWKIGSSKYKIHTFFHGGFRFKLSDKWTFLPYYIVRFPPKGKISTDFDFVLSYKNKIDFAFGIRNKDALLFLIQYKFKENFVLSYSYDHVISSLGKNLYPSHEIGFSFGTCKNKIEGRAICPLF